jgi:hypothetical protein
VLGAAVETAFFKRIYTLGHVEALSQCGGAVVAVGLRILER